MNAFVSGQSALAVCFDGDTVTSIHGVDGSQEVARSPWEIPRLLADSADIIELKGVDRARVLEALKEAWSRDRALRMVLLTLDPQTSGEVRGSAVACLEDFLKDPVCDEYVRNILSAAPLPGPTTIDDLETNVRGYDRTRGFFERLSTLQPAIARVRQAWDAIPQAEFPAERANPTSEQARQSFAAVAARVGAFRLLAEAVAETGARGAGAVLVKLLLDPELKSRRNARGVLDAWVRPLREGLHDPAAKSVAEIEPETEETMDFGDRPRLRNKFGRAVFENVEKQKAGILQALREGKVRVAFERVEDLISTQRTNSTPRQLAQSLCDLAAEAKRTGDVSSQMRLMQLALEVDSSDGWVLRQLADAFLRNARPDDALAAYDDAARDFPTNVVARCGRAEVLRELGRLDDALAAYDDAARDFPTNVVARNGRAEVLRELGRLDDALAAYDAAARDFPKDAVARCGRAEVLRELGRLDDALAAYDDAARDFPKDAVARNGRLSVLTQLGRLEEVLRASEGHARTRLEWTRRHIHTVALLRLGRIEEAVRLLESSLAGCPWAEQKAYFASTLAVARLRLREFAAAAGIVDLMRRQRSEVALLIGLHAFGGAGRRKEAVTRAAALATVKHAGIIPLRDELTARYAADRPRADWRSDDWVFEQECNLLLAMPFQGPTSPAAAA